MSWKTGGGCSWTAMLLAAVAVSGIALARDPIYVDKMSQQASDEPGTPGTEAQPFLTIQGAVDQAEPGDLILVKPGVYDVGGKPHVVGGIAHTNRLYLTTENLTIRSTKGAAVTHIVGQKDYGTADPAHCGPAAVRCVYAYNAKGSVLQGFTLRDGASDYSTVYSDSSQYLCGGVSVDIKTAPNDFYLVDCVVSNCAAYKATGLRNGTGIRCLFANNEAVSTGAASGGSRLLCCVATGNRRTSGSGSSVLSTCLSINCTIVGNAITDFAGNGETYNSLCYGNASDATAGTFQNTLRTKDLTRPPVMSPATGDFRPADPAVNGAGDAAHLALVSAPAELLGTDFAGNSLPLSGPMDVGAVQGAVTPVAGALVFHGQNVTVEGVGVPVNSWIRPTAYPTQYVVCADVPTGSHLFGLESSFASVKAWRFPDLQNRFFIVPPPEADKSVDLTVTCTKCAYYVAPAPKGSNSNPGTASEPFADLQKAVDASTGGETYSVVYAEPGDYRTGGKPYNTTTQPLTNRVLFSHSVLLRGAGAASTFITGAEDPVGFRGNGLAAVRCVACFNTAYAVGVQGFTLRNGHTLETDAVYDGNKTSANDMNGSAVAGWGAGQNLTVLDCDITANGGTNNLISKACCERCRIYSNRMGVAFVNDNSRLVSCLAYDNLTYKGASYIGNGSSLLNCTVVGDPQSYMGAGVTFFGYNSIFDTAKGNYVNQTLDGSLLWNYTETPKRQGAVYADPSFYNRAADDYRVTFDSPSRTCGVVPAAETFWTNDFRYATSGLDGEKLVFGVASTAAGALMKPVGGMVLDTRGFLSVTKDGVPVDTDRILLDADEEVVIAPISSTHSVLGFALNGATNLFGAAASLVVKGSDVQTGAVLTPVYSPDLYVDAVGGNDAWSGGDAASPKKTLSAILSNAIAGDVVHAAAGVYSEGSATANDGDLCRARAVVPTDVTLVSDEGAEMTFIEGENAPEPELDSGVGSNAVRCVFLKPGACVRGFTLRKGRTACVGRGTDVAKTHDDNIGAAVRGETCDHGSVPVSTRVENCIITDCTAWRTGGAAYCTLERCRVTGCSSADTSYNVTGTYNCRHRNTYLKTPSRSTHLVMYPVDFISSTACASSGHAVYAAWNDALIVNSVSCGNAKLFAGQTVAPVGTYFTNRPDTEKGTDGVLGEGCVVTNSAALTFDNFGKPVLGQNVAIDGGVTAAVDVETVGSTDLYGVQRIYNGAIDAGACEHDWRTQYTTVVCGRRIVVSEASPEAVLDNGGIVLPDGQLEFAWQATNPSLNTAVLAAEVTGGGMLVVTVNGTCVATLTSAGGRKDVALGAGQGLASVVCAYRPTSGEAGFARVYGLAAKSGLVMVVR